MVMGPVSTIHAAIYESMGDEDWFKGMIDPDEKVKPIREAVDQMTQG